VANVPADPVPPASNDVHANDVARQIQAILQAGLPDGSGLVQTTVAGQPIRAWHQADSKRIAASTIKLPILIGVLVGDQTGQLDLHEQYTIRRSDVVGGTGELQGEVGRTLTYAEIMRLMVTRSDNVGANVLLRRLGKGDAANGMMRVNRIFAEEGYRVTHVERTMIDLDAQRRGIENWVSAEELARMLDEIRRGTLLGDVSPAISSRALALLRERGAVDREWLGLKLDRGWSLAHINGTLDTVRNDAGIISGPGGREFILVACQDRLSNPTIGEQRIADVASKIQRLLARESP
jgi:beta-lactamase class A